MTKNYAKMNMDGNTQFRPEQFTLQQLFRVLAPKLKICMEYPVFSSDGRVLAVIDFADISNKIAYRLQSAVSPHDTHKGTRKYDNQERELIRLGWKVINIHEDSYEWNFLWK